MKNVDNAKYSYKPKDCNIDLNATGSSHILNKSFPSTTTHEMPPTTNKYSYINSSSDAEDQSARMKDFKDDETRSPDFHHQPSHHRISTGVFPDRSQIERYRYQSVGEMNGRG